MADSMQECDSEVHPQDFAEASEVVDIADEDSRDEQAEGRDAGEVRVLSRPTDSSSSLVTNPFARLAFPSSL